MEYSSVSFFLVSVEYDLTENYKHLSNQATNEIARPIGA